MGKPSGLYRNDVWIPDPGQEEYPTLKDVLPPGLRELTLHAGRWSAFGTALETKFKTYLSLGSTEERIEKVSLYWDPLESDYPLPMNFWSIKKFYSEHEVRVDYTLQIMYENKDDAPWYSLADTLVERGEQGIEMARYLSTASDRALTTQLILEHLELDESWWQSDAAKQVIFPDTLSPVDDDDSKSQASATDNEPDEAGDDSDEQPRMDDDCEIWGAVLERSDMGREFDDDDNDHGPHYWLKPNGGPPIVTMSLLDRPTYHNDSN